jgi:16S rRNA (guanine966-N2)-methyltransferase
MRILTGTAKGIKLKTTNDNSIRPTTDRTKESLFNILEHNSVYKKIEKKRVLDLFSGTGSLGIEALSRGAEYCLFVDNDHKSNALIEENLKACNLLSKAKIIRKDIKLFKKISSFGVFDIIFADPPYNMNYSDLIIRLSIEEGLLKKNGFIVIEESKNVSINWPNNYKIITERVYAKTKIHIAMLKEL